ncbi:lyase family protein [Kineococcus sp. SYSU DK018]|uniref:lyase family protein n=1 Tax=Kineococcus sp. SYSU DK018 TaxID=3383139 RepID=UPI003D7EF72F
MTAASLFWPGLHRAGEVFTDTALVAALVRVEAAWLDALAAAGLSPAGGRALAGAAEGHDGARLAELAEAAEAGGNPVIPLVAGLRRHAAATAGAEAAAAVHRGLTSQDVVDTALQLCARDVVTALRTELDAQVAALADLAVRHRGTLTVARTLTQHALPTTFAARVASWLTVLLDARDALTALPPAPAQFGGAVGTLASLVDRLAGAGAVDPVAAADAVAADAARRLGLAHRPPWHTARRPVTVLGDAFTAVTDALGRVAADVLTGSRSEIGELREPGAPGRGTSSTMPQKRNPALSVLVRRTADTAPALAAQLHAAAAAAGDERPAGAWHAEWAPLAALARTSLAAARQATELLIGLEVDTGAMGRTLRAALPGVLAERLVPALAQLPTAGGALGTDGAREALAACGDVAALRALLGERTSAPGAELDALLARLGDPRGYLGTADLVVDAVLARARG